MFKNKVKVQKVHFLSSPADGEAVFLALRYEIVDNNEKNCLAIPVPARIQDIHIFDLYAHAQTHASDFFGSVASCFPSTRRRQMHDDDDEEEDEEKPAKAPVKEKKMKMIEYKVSICSKSTLEADFGFKSVNYHDFNFIVCEFSISTNASLDVAWTYNPSSNHKNQLYVPSHQLKETISYEDQKLGIFGEPELDIDQETTAIFNHTIYTANTIDVGQTADEMLKNMRNRFAIGSFNVIVEPVMAVKNVIFTFKLPVKCEELRIQNIVGKHPNDDLVYPITH